MTTFPSFSTVDHYEWNEGATVRIIMDEGSGINNSQICSSGKEGNDFIYLLQLLTQFPKRFVIFEHMIDDDQDPMR